MEIFNPWSKNQSAILISNQNKNNYMKQFHFNVQAKGGSGKSMLTYLQALKNETSQRSYFIDLDSSVKTSLQQLKFLQGKTLPW